MLRRIKKKIKELATLSSPKKLSGDGVSDEEVNPAAMELPEDVKEGHFVVLAVDCDQPKRFVLELAYLSHPEFLKLLEQAEEEFGFNQKGALAIPCRPEDLQRILRDRS
nr:TPA_asm: hypothetical protein HUJ06_030011 [Nelumbo nucifera]